MLSIGIDSETVNGKPHTLQYFSTELDMNVVEFVTEKTAFKSFIRFIDKLPQNDSHYIMWGHNLTFDLVSFFYSERKKFLSDRFEFQHGKWNISGLYSTGLCYVFLRHDSKHKTVYMLDTFRFFQGSLAKLAQLFCPHLPKLAAPEGLGEKYFTAKDKKFLAYAIRDAEITHTVGNVIMDLWTEYDVRPSVSQAQMAARIFRHKYVEHEIPLQDKRIVYASLHSYHGGKNNLTVKRGLYKNCRVIDIVSAYPFAMSLMPSFSRPDLYKGLKATDVDTRVPEFGIYKVTGTAKKCRWPVFFSHGFKPVHGPFRDLWVTGFEINEALRKKEVEIKSLYGFFYDAIADTTPSPFKGYVRDFFKLKDTAPDKVRRQFAKILLNALYGKFIEKRKNSVEQNYTYDLDNNVLLDNNINIIAGGLFNPFIASLITGHTRAYIHRLEHEYRALHTATDGIITQKKLKKEQPELGGVKTEVTGDCYIFRNKVYIFYSRKKSDKPSKIFKGKYIHKYAHHGFHGDIYTLEKMIQSDTFEYEYTKVNKLKESFRSGLQVNKFEKRTASLNLTEKG